MSNNKINDLNHYINWLNNSIDGQLIKNYEYSDFENIQQIGRGSYGNVDRANWKYSDRLFALKSFNYDEQTLKEVIKELKLHRSVDDHDNIIRLYGIAKVEDANHQIKKYSLVLEYANGGTLNAYLNEHFHELDWNNKSQLALQLASAVEYIHDYGIIHRDLHANNILVHEKNIKLADFGLSKKIAEASSNSSKLLGVIPYVDPKSFNNDNNNQSQNYKLNKKSDVYSIGVLLWQISSGYEPLKNKEFGVGLIMAIHNGLREEIIDGTPAQYSKLYTECWKHEPNERPNMQKVVTTLKAVISSKQDNVICNGDEKKEKEIYKPILNSSKETISIDDGLDINNYPNLNIDEYKGASLQNHSLNKMKNSSISNTTKENKLNRDIGEYESMSLQNHTLDKTEIENSISSASNQVTESLFSYGNQLLLELEANGFTTPDEKAEELIKNLTKIKHIYALKLLFENQLNQFSPQVLRDSLVALVDSKSFDFYAKQSVARLEFHIRTWVAVLECICFSEIVLSEKLQDKVYKSIAKFAEIHNKTTQIINNNFRSNFNQFNQQENYYIISKHNYNIDFLLIHLRDTLHSLCDDDNWFQELLRRARDLLKAILNVAPGLLPKTASEITVENDDNSTLSILAQLHQDLKFKHPVASYYVDWRIILIIQYNLEKIISKKFGEKILIEYLWSYLEREWDNVADQAMLNSQTKFDEVLNKLSKSLKNSGSFLNNLTGSEPLSLPDTLWFGILDLAQSLIQRSTQTATYGLCYYLAIESLNKAPSSFIQFKSIEVLLHLYNINSELFLMIELDFDQYSQKLDENNSKKFHKLLTFVKEKCQEGSHILNNNIKKDKGKEKGKGKCSDQNMLLNSHNILDTIANEMTCPISSEPTDYLCILKCQHVISLNNLKKLKQKTCPKCREKIEDNDLKYLPQNTIYKNLYSQFFEAGHILPSIELENSAGQITNNQYASDSDNSDVDLILSKKKKFIRAFKLNSNISLQSIFQSKKQHLYQSVMKALDEKNYEKAEYLCKEFLRKFPKSYSVKCILAYIYRCLNNYEQSLLCLNEAINLKKKHPIAWYIYGEINFRQSNYDIAIEKLEISIDYKVKSINPYILSGLSYSFKDDNSYNNYYYRKALENFNIVLQEYPNNYLCLKNCAYCYEKQSEYPNALQMLDILLSINRKDSLILCYYGEILNSMKRYNDAIPYFTEASIIDPENSHILIKRAISYYLLQKYEEALLDFNKSIKLDPDNVLVKIYMSYLAHLLDNNSSKDFDELLLFVRCRIYIELEKYSMAESDFDNLFELKDNDISFVYLLQKYSDFWSHLCKIRRINNYDYYFTEFGLIDKFNIYMFKVKNVYLISNLINLDHKLCQFQESNSNVLSGPVLSYKGEGEVLDLYLPKFSNILLGEYDIVWKINVKKILSEDCFIKFVTKRGKINSDKIDFEDEHILKYEDVLKLKGIGCVEYKSYKSFQFDVINGDSMWVQLSIETNRFIHMQIDYVRFIKCGDPYQGRNRVSKMGHSLPFHINYPNVPEAFKDIYFSRKEMENLLELKDIINNL